MKKTVASIAAATVALTLAAAPLATAAPGQVAGPLPGEVTTNLEAAKKITGRLTLTQPKATYVSNGSSYGAVLKVTYLVKNESNTTVNVLGPASNWRSKLYQDKAGEEMLVNCSWPFPLKAGESSFCTMYRLITDGEKRAGITFGDAPQFFPSYQVGSERTRILLHADRVGLVPLFEGKR